MSKPTAAELLAHKRSLITSTSDGDVLNARCPLCVLLHEAGYGNYGDKPLPLVTS
jgi:hypothetical protein